MTTNSTTNECKSEQVKEIDFKLQNETKGQSESSKILFNFYGVYSCYIFSNIDNLKIGKLMTYIFNITL